ncbi:ankyrin repeat-containing domain protein [Mycena rebaudengoi]|nr:ankyrin repeat-containing domain protein [Mycena rebaudengoi]
MIFLADAACTIPSDPDISGMGVRIAIYIQNLLSFIPVAAVLWDREVSSFELATIQGQSTTILITAFAILISAMVEVRTIGLSSFHANIILSLSWMNNTNTFVYFLLYVHNKSQEGRGHIPRNWASWMKHFQEELQLTLSWKAWKRQFIGFGDSNKMSSTSLASRSPTESIFTKIVLLLGTIHLTLMAVLGMWLWSRPGSLGVSTPCASTTVLGQPAGLDSRALRGISLTMYSVFLTPGVNLILPMALFLGLFLGYHAVRGPLHRICDRLLRLLRTPRLPMYRQLHPSIDEPSIVPTVLGLVFLGAINIIFIVDIELTLRDNQLSDESAWSFGQILAILLLVLPIRDILDATIARLRTKSVREALRKELPTEKILTLATQPGADLNTRALDAKYKTLLHMAVGRGDEILVAILLRLRADPNIEVHQVLEAALTGEHVPILRRLLENGANPQRNTLFWQRFQQAVAAENLGTVRSFLEMRVTDREFQGVQYGRALHVALRTGNGDLVRLLLDSGADPNLHRDEHGTSLHVASQTGQTDVVQLLLDKSAEPNIEALEAAVVGEHMQIVRLLLTRGADPMRSQLFWNSFQKSVAAGNLENVRLFLEMSVKDGVFQDSQYATALHEASKQKNRDLVQLLLDSGADPNVKGDGRETALDAASQLGQKEIVELLLDRGSDPNSGNGVLEAAVAGEHMQIVWLLLEKGADPQRSQIFWKRFQKAVSAGNLGAVRSFLQMRVTDREFQGVQYGIALHGAMESYRSRKMVQLLLDAGADPNIHEAEHRTPLYTASRAGRTDIVQLLLDKSAEPNIKALDAAAAGNHMQIVRLFLAKGVNPATSSNFWYSFHDAVKREDLETVRLFVEMGVTYRAFQGGQYAQVLLAASRGKNRDLVQLLLDGGADPTVTMAEPVLHAASRSGHPAIVELLLDRKADPNLQGGCFNTALVAASYNNHLETVHLLLHRGADPNIAGGEAGTALHAAANTHSLRIVQLLLTHGADPNIQGGHFCTPLQVASIGNNKLVQILLEHGADPNIQGGRHGTALNAAVDHGGAEIVRLLLDYGADPNIKGTKFGTALQGASAKGKTEIVQLLLDRGADPDIRGDSPSFSLTMLSGILRMYVQGGSQGTALQIASDNGFADLVRLLLDRGADPNIHGGYFGTALCAAAAREHPAIVELLLNRGANPNIQGGEDGRALQVASKAQGAKIVKLLLKHGADPNIQDSDGRYRTALQVAASNGRIETVQLLLARGADPNIQGGTYGSALQAASCSECPNLVRLLLDHRADPNVQGGYYGTALQAASYKGDLETVRTLLDHHADPNIQGGQHGTALQAASLRGSTEIVQLLLDRGVDPNVLSGSDGTALQAAAVFERTSTVRLLLDRGADPDIQGGRYGTALQAASKSGKVQIVRLLLARGADPNIQGGEYGT